MLIEEIGILRGLPGPCSEVAASQLTAASDDGKTLVQALRRATEVFPYFRPQVLELEAMIETVSVVTQNPEKE